LTKDKIYGIPLHARNDYFDYKEDYRRYSDNNYYDFKTLEGLANIEYEREFSNRYATLERLEEREQGMHCFQYYFLLLERFLNNA
jgi:hypothetical protein